MSYKIFLRGGGVKVVSDADGKKLRALFLDPDMSRRTHIEIDDDAMELGVVTSVQYRRDEDKKPELDQTYAGKLEIYAKQPVEEKVRRELDARIKPGLTEEMLGRVDFGQVRGVVRHFFENNLEYPWCPMVVWRDLVLVEATVPRFYEYVTLNDSVVSAWLGKRIT